MARFLQMRGFVGLVFLIGLGGVVLFAAQRLSAAMERTKTFRYFDEALTAQAKSPDSLVWRENGQLDRPFTKPDEYEVGVVLSDAWRLYAAALVTGDAQYLPDRFSGPALLRAVHASQRDTAEGPRQVAVPKPAMAVLQMNPLPMFHHLDGSMVVLEDRPLTARFVLDADRKLAQFRLSRDATTTVLMNESTGWRIFAHEMRQSTQIMPSRAQSSDLRPRGAMPRLAGVNYYPAATPWRAFWPSYDEAIIAKDLDLLRDLGGNAVRIFLPRADFLDPVQQKTNLRRLEAFLYLAHQRGLKVIPTLFDLKGDYAPHLWAYDDAMLRAVLPVLAASPAVVLVDLKNEPDLDYETHGAGVVQAWLATMAGVARDVAPDLPLTVGFAAAGPSVDLPPEVQGWLDVVSYHDYAPIDQAAERLAQVRAEADGRPVMITEIGASSWSLGLGLPSSDDKQAWAVEQRLDLVALADGLFIWTLHDFPKPDATAVGSSPWVLGLQSRFGLVDAQGQEKPAGTAARTFFTEYLTEQGDG